mmetsp:Transcript_33623/g.72540  ORF Transcript_33623/g.72540 Transcript_33623/m.72540 type:complete len:253 (+) Transcript_33623:231-989(+)
MVLEAGLVAPLVSYLSALDEDVQANAAGAIQSICFQETGRDYLRDLGVIPPVVGLLGSENIKVRTRAVGVVHNMSADAASIGDIRREGGIPHLLELLRAPQLAVCCSAAGALQNISRETASQQVILENNGVSTCRTDDPMTTGPRTHRPIVWFRHTVPDSVCWSTAQSHGTRCRERSGPCQTTGVQEDPDAGVGHGHGVPWSLHRRTRVTTLLNPSTKPTDVLGLVQRRDQRTSHTPLTLIHAIPTSNKCDK